MIPCWVFLVTVPLKYHPRRALALLLRKVGGARSQKERKGSQRYWRDGHIYRPMPNLAMDLALGDRREQAAERALAGSARRKGLNTQERVVWSIEVGYNHLSGL